MKVPRLPTLLLISATLLLPVRAADQPVIIYMAADGSDSNPGTAEKPMATLEAARDAVRQQREPGRAARVVIADGTYPLRGTVEFTPEDSGVIYEAAPGAKPVFSGGTRITSWKKQGEHLWQAKLPDVAAGDWYFEQLWVNGRRATRARTPNEDWTYMRGATAKGRDPLTGSDADLRHALIMGYPDTLAPLDGVPQERLSDVTAVVYHSWEISRHRGRFFDPKNDALYVTEIATNKPSDVPPFIDFAAGKRYHLENFRAALDSPGEWFLDRDGTLLYWPLPGEDMSKAEVVAPRVGQFIRIKGDEEKPVENLTFRGLRFLYGQYILPPGGQADAQAAHDIPAVILADDAKRIAFEDCEIAHVGLYAIWFRSGCEGNTMRNCYLHDLGAGGFRVGNGWPSDGAPSRRVSSHNVVENNIIHGGGRIHYGAIGVWIGHSSDNIVAHNDISDFIYTGISAGWNWGYTESSAKRNLIEFNQIHHLGSSLLGDMAGIYTLGLSEGTVIRGNHIHHLRSNPDGVYGIYLDQASTGIVVRDNLVHDIGTACFYQHFGRDNLLENNIFAYPLQTSLRRALLEPHESFRAERNIMVEPGGSFFGGTLIEGKVSLDRNLYWPAKGKTADFGGMSFSAWQQLGQDKNSLVADPGFADAAGRDFHLAADSPALGLGFVPFDYSQAGVQGGRAWRKLAGGQLFPDFNITPHRPPMPPLDLEEGFEAFLWSSLLHAVSNGGDAMALAPTDEVAASGKRSLKFADQAGLNYPFDPHLVYWPNHTRGITRCSFNLRLGPGAEFQHEWRDNATPYLSGPGFVISGGVLQVAGKTLPLPQDQWIHFEIKAGLGEQSTGTWDMTVQVPGEPAHHFTDLPSQPGWKSLEWLGFISNASGPSVFYLDNVMIHNKPGK
jgi:hypothetical protein